MLDFVLKISDTVVIPGNQPVRVVGTETQYALHLDFKQAQYVIAGNLAVELLLYRLKARVHIRHCRIHVRRLLVLLGLVYTFFDKITFEAGKEQHLAHFAQLNLKLALQYMFRAVHRPTQHIADTQKFRLTVLDNAAVGRNLYLTVGEGVQRIDCLVRRRTWLQMYEYARLAGRKVLDLAYLDFSFFKGFEYRLDQCIRGFAERYFGNGQCTVVELFYFRAYLQRASSGAIVIAGHVNETAGYEIGVETKFLAMQIGHCGIDDFVEVVRKYLRRQTHGYALGALGEKQREFCRQGHGLVLAPVVTQHPLRHLGTVQHIKCKLRKARLNVTACGRGGAREDVAPVTLSLDKEVLLAKLHKRVVDGRIAVRVILHCSTDYIGYLVEAAVIKRLHCMQDTALHRLQTVLHMWHGAFENHIRGIFQKPVLVHTLQQVTRHFSAAHVRQCRSMRLSLDIRLADVSAVSIRIA